MHTFRRARLTALAICLVAALAVPAMAQNTGSIFTSTYDGTSWDVNANVLSNPMTVYLDGGPHNTNASGLPLGDYYFQVTDPSGKYLLSTDDIACRTVHVSANTGGNGVIYGVPSVAPACSHQDALFLGYNPAPNGGDPVLLWPYAITPNGGGVYKLWLTPINKWKTCVITYGVADSSSGVGTTTDSANCVGSFGFDPGSTKTDNFKINCTTQGSGFCGITPPAVIAGIKYNDTNQNGLLDSTETGLGNWEIDVTVGSTTTQLFTDQDGNWSIPIASGTTFTACEVLQTGWYQSGPPNPYPYPLPLTGASVQTISGVNCWRATAGATDTSGFNFGNYQALPLTVSKTATPAFTRTYGWSIKKAVDKTLVEQNGGTATFNYTVTASETGFTDSAWQVTGTITVVNHNSLLTFGGVKVTDAINDGGTCSVTLGSGVLIAPGSSTFNYTCTYTGTPSPLTGGTNTATVDWSLSGISTVGGTTSSTGTAAVSFTTPTSTVDKTITVTDNFNGTTTTLGTLTATDTTPYTSATYTYAHTVPVTANTCVTYNNTATISTTPPQSASQTVTECGAVAGGLTMGFWQNKNGQGIITAGKSTAGVCNSGTWLRLYAPFQDLSATATCAQVGTYVTNIIKAASAAGSTENPMLKAQMLATALDVYFGNGLGGDPIGAPASFSGGVKIDLTKVCVMIDGSSGTATCGGTYKNVSAAFGGASSLTINQILAYAASQSNSGGSVWYGQVKATQDLAKNTFDAINNGVALVAP